MDAKSRKFVRPISIALILMAVLLTACQPYQGVWTDQGGNTIKVEYIPAVTQQPGQPTQLVPGGSQTETPVPATTGTPQAQPTANPTTAPATVTGCDGVPNMNGASYAEKDLLPGQTFLGDPEAFLGKWVVLHDTGSGEYGVIRNVGSTPVKIRAKWGTGCLWSTDQSYLVNSQLTDHPDDCKVVRDVEINGDQYVEKFFPGCVVK